MAFSAAAKAAAKAARKGKGKAYKTSHTDDSRQQFIKAMRTRGKKK